MVNCEKKRKDEAPESDLMVSDALNHKMSQSMAAEDRELVGDHVSLGLDVGVPAPEGPPPTWFFDGVAVGPSGAIYISEKERNVLTRSWPRLTTR